VRLLVPIFVAACATTPSGPPPVKSLQVNQTGEQVELARVLVPGYVTIVDFWSQSCGACVIVGDKVSTAIATQARVVMRKIDVGDGFTPVAKSFEIEALPHYNVYDRKQRLRYILVGNDCLRAPDLARALVAEH
jgi:Thioredoxin